MGQLSNEPSQFSTDLVTCDRVNRPGEFQTLVYPHLGFGLLDSCATLS